MSLNIEGDQEGFSYKTLATMPRGFVNIVVSLSYLAAVPGMLN